MVIGWQFLKPIPILKHVIAKKVQQPTNLFYFIFWKWLIFQNSSNISQIVVVDYYFFFNNVPIPNEFIAEWGTQLNYELSDIKN